MRHAKPELHPPTLDEFKDFARRIISASKDDVEQQLAKQQHARRRKRLRAAHA